jgi:hypothetical protein
MSSKRLPVTLEVSDERAIESFLESGRPESEMLRRWADAHQMPVVASQSAVLRLLARVGAESLHQQAIEAGYAKLAEQGAAEKALAETRRQRRDRNRARRSA